MTFNESLKGHCDQVFCNMCTTGDAQLTVDELRDMVGREGEAFSNRVLHYAARAEEEERLTVREHFYRKRQHLDQEDLRSLIDDKRKKHN